MVDPYFYLDLIDFFLKKRDVAYGGVEGFRTPFSFKIDELSARLKNDQKELKKALDTMVYDGVLTGYIEESDGYIVNGCTSENLNNYKEKVKKLHNISRLEVNEKKREVKYGSNTLRFNKTITWYVFLLLHKNYPNVVTYEAIIKEGYECEESDITKNKIHRIISGINRRMAKKEFPQSIKSKTNEGYYLGI